MYNFFLGLKQIRKYILELYLCTKIMAATTASSRMQPPNITIETTCVDVLSPLLYSVDVFRSIIILQYLLQNSWSLYAVFYELEMCLDKDERMIVSLSQLTFACFRFSVLLLRLEK